jgi:hypothetical protein
MINIPINNINDLESEILRLEALEETQRLALKPRFSSPSAIIATVLTLFPKSPTADGIKHSGLFNQDFLGLISRFLIPLTLNKTLFKHSNFIVKALVGIASQKASNYISEDALTGVWGKVKSLFKKKQKEPETETAAYGIPPQSDLYDHKY